MVGFDFNAAALAQMNSAIGGQWAFGGAVTTLDNPSRAENIFGGSGSSPARLAINAPEPSTLVLAAVGLPMVLRRRR